MRFNVSPKGIGKGYFFLSAFFVLFGFALVGLLRVQLAFPGQAFPLFEKIPFLKNWFPGGVLAPEAYYQIGSMHGSIMIFLGIVPLGAAAFANALVPPLIGASQLAFPKLGFLGLITFFAAGLTMFASFFCLGGAASSGWTSYPPLSVLASSGQSLWCIGIILLGLSTQLGSINLLATILHKRAPGMAFFRMPLFVWAQGITSFLLLIAFPPLQFAALLQLSDRVLGSSFFLPSGLWVSGAPVAASGGGNPLLWQHLFWFLAHPEVYVLILPGIGIVAEILSSHGRTKIYGYSRVVYSLLFLGVLSFLVWAHHMFLTGMGTTLSVFFQATTLIISVPSVVVLVSFLLSLWGSHLRYSTALCFALAFIPMFAIGGLTGVPLALSITNIPLHDTYYVIGHFHYLVAPGTIFALFAGVYHWYPRWTGRFLDDGLGKIHFWTSLVAMNVIFFPMLLMGLAGVSRRLYDQNIYFHGQAAQGWNVYISYGAWALALFQVPFLFNFVKSYFRGEKVTEANPWGATTLDWSNAPVSSVVRGPYQYEGERPLGQEAP